MGHVLVREVLMRWYRQKRMELPEGYRMCHYGKEQEDH